MVKLLKPRLRPMAPKLRSTREIRDTRYSPDSTVRSWYKSARWQRLRLEVLARDLYTCQQTGVLLVGKAPAPDSAVVDHIKPHKGDPALFWSPENLQSVAKSWHDKVKQGLEKRGSLG